jgi:hypothetical protein
MWGGFYHDGRFTMIRKLTAALKTNLIELLAIMVNGTVKFTGHAWTVNRIACGPNCIP